MDDQPKPIFVLDPNTHFDRRQIGGRTTFVVRHPALDKFFHMGVSEHRVAMLLDGERNVQEIASQMSAEGSDWTAEEVSELILRFVQSNLAVPIEGSGERPPVATANWTQRSLKILSSFISQRLPLFACNRLATKLNGTIGFLFSIPAMIGWAILVASGILIVSQNRTEFSGEIARIFDNHLWIAMIAMWVIAKGLHELGHATAAKHNGVHVGKAGIMFFLLAPLAYVDVTDAWKLTKRWQRIQISLAGVYVELAVASVAIWAWWCLEDGLLRHLAAQCFLVAGPATLLVNANPLLRLDGYYVLSDLTEIPNLRMHGRAQLAGWFNRVLLGLPAERSLLSGWRRPFATAHAFCSVLFQIVWMGGLVIAVAWWAKGLGLVLAIAASLMWCLIPMSRWAIAVWKRPANSAIANGGPLIWGHRFRLVALGCCAIALSVYALASPSPFARRVPVVVRFHCEQIVRASSDAFVRDVLVSNGDRVRKGELLIELENPDLLLRLEERRDERLATEISEIEARKNGDLSLAAAEAEHNQSLSRQIVELETEVADLKTYASRDGVVIGTNLDSLTGRFISQGDELMTVCDPQEKELVASVGPSDIEAYRQISSGTDAMTVRLRGGTRFVAHPTPLHPRATNQLPHAALGANVGGPIPVEMQPDRDANNSGPRPVNPQMESVTRLDPIISSRVQSGQLGTMAIADTRSIARRIIDAMR